MDHEPRFRILAGIAGVAAFGAVLVSAYLPVYETPRSALEVTAILVVIACVAEQLAVEFSDRMTLAASNLPILLATMFLGALPAVVVALTAGAWGAWRERSRWVALFNTSDMGLSALVASVVFLELHRHYGFSLTTISGSLLLSGAAAAVVYEVTEVALMSVAVWAKYDRSIASFWRGEIGPFLQSVVVLIGLGLAVAALYARAGIIAVALLFVPLFAAQYMFKLLVRERGLLKEQQDLSEQYLEMNIGLAAAMVVLIDSKDEYTADHSAAVAMYCRDMAIACGLSETEIEEIHLAGLLHDLGKVGTPDAILRKAEPLNEEEWEYIRQHPEKGAEVLSHLATYRNVADIVRYHHERLDGSGYPSGLRANQIPEASKILAVADSYHAITSNRPYRQARSSFEALKELNELAGVTLDARYIEALGRILRDKDLAYRDGTATDFMDEYQRGRLNLRLRGEPITDVSGLSRRQEDPGAS
jgi:putative nucleotidyltransferase with HDIG domain